MKALKDELQVGIPSKILIDVVLCIFFGRHIWKRESGRFLVERDTVVRCGVMRLTGAAGNYLIFIFTSKFEYN